MANVRLLSINKSFDGKKNVLDNISLCVEDKSFVVIIGPSGCGKTTMLNIIAGLELCTSGDIYINNKRVNDVEPKDRDIAMVFQSYALYPHLSVYDNLAFTLTIKRLPKDKIDHKVNNVAALLGISELLNRKPRQLSGGQMQRVAIGKAMVRNPAVFLMDEPLSNLDANLKTSMRYELSRLHKELGATFIYVTHDQIEAMTLATMLVVMNEGRIQQVGTPYEVYMKPRNMFVGQFIGTPSMNLFNCGITKQNNNYYANLLGLNLQVDILDTNEDAMCLGDRIIIGIRPEDFILCKNEIGIHVDIVHYEVLGSEIILHCEMEISESFFVIRTTTDESLMDLKQINVLPRRERIHFFHPITGERLNKSQL